MNLESKLQEAIVQALSKLYDHDVESSSVTIQKQSKTLKVILQLSFFHTLRYPKNLLNKQEQI